MTLEKAWIAGSLTVVLLVAGFAVGSAPKWLDGWSAEDIAVLSSLHLTQLPPAPKDPSNAYESQPAAVQLGQRIFFDRRFSGNGAVACASCHDPKKQFQDGQPLGIGIGTGNRRTMPIVAAGFSPFLFWDGRKDSLWSQALGPLEDPLEHGGNRLRYAHLLNAHYRAQYETSFGPMPDLSRLPPDASPIGGAAQVQAWSRLDDASRRDVSRVFTNMGKALAAYEKTLQYGQSRMDKYVASLVSGDATAPSLLTSQEKNGLRIFIGKGQCITCHNGPLLTDQHFHNTGVAPTLSGKPDMGRNAALAKVKNDEFNCLGRFSDARPEQCEELRFLSAGDHALEAAFKTPSLRNVSLRPPYMHAGQIGSLTDVVRHYRQAPASQTGHSELHPRTLSEREVGDVVEFLKTLSGPVNDPANGT